MARLGVHLGGLKVVQGTNDIFAKSLAFTDRNGKVMVEFGIVANHRPIQSRTRGVLRWDQLVNDDEALTEGPRLV